MVGKNYRSSILNILMYSCNGWKVNKRRLVFFNDLSFRFRKTSSKRYSYLLYNAIWLRKSNKKKNWLVFSAFRFLLFSSLTNMMKRKINVAHQKFFFCLPASIKCFCNNNACVQRNSTTCIASYACYAEMSNATATYGCIHKVDHTSICVRRGSYSQVFKSKPYLLTCCYRSLCNRHYKGEWLFSVGKDIS